MAKLLIDGVSNIKFLLISSLRTIATTSSYDKIKHLVSQKFEFLPSQIKSLVPQKVIDPISFAKIFTDPWI